MSTDPANTADERFGANDSGFVCDGNDDFDIHIAAVCLEKTIDRGAGMERVANWFGRKFEFSFPVELYPDLCMRLRGTPARLEEIVRGCARDRMLRSPQAKWSAQEHAGHMSDLEALWMARLEDFAAERSQMTVADLTNRGTDEAHHNERELKTILEQFRGARLRFLNRLEDLDPMQFARTIPHPRLAVPMRLVDHLFFVAEHDDHHLAIIWQMIREA